MHIACSRHTYNRNTAALTLNNQSTLYLLPPFLKGYIASVNLRIIRYSGVCSLIIRPIKSNTCSNGQVSVDIHIILQLYVFTFLVLCAKVLCQFRAKPMFGSYLL